MLLLITTKKRNNMITVKRHLNGSTLQLIGAIFIATLATSSLTFAKEGPCKMIRDACEKAGFIKGEAKIGKGLWADCIDPIMQGTVAKKSVLPLPSVDAAAIAQCKQKRPNFGAGKVAK
jgi:hypothetical protein